jgi:FtsZ-binding cell division protein ZapB
VKIIESFKEKINNSLKEILENIGKQAEALREKTNSLKKYRKTQSNR